MENPAIKKALTIEQAFMKSKIERRIYELREKAVRDEISALAGAKEEGLQQGHQKAVRENTIAALRAGLDVNLVAQITGLDIEEVQKLKEDLNKQSITTKT
ncbi:Rpn family recombination-promoting nuclease/transposase, putative [Heliorestis convoluta]|uniref:Rpn family recombination-promoting nuclease/transposase, putative n=1 Tax=Heliorestis convoluta TaxID=356322 RepID=A0A5Q2N140_9FIRM|nr:Rpn family recombination-promoting nuclease/transposase, putative [Heliorestis convoluta]